MSARAAPVVSVLMAVHDGRRHLREALESLFAQTFDDFELVLVDDASTDDSRAIAESYGDARVRILANDENLGLTRSLNRGLAVARGRYVARLDADDVAHRERLALQVAHLDRHPDLALVASAYRRIDEDGGARGERHVPLSSTAIRWHLLFLNAFAHSSVTFRRSVAESLGGYDDAVRYPQDYELWSRIAAGHDVAALPQCLVSYRHSESSMTTALDDDGGADEMTAISRQNIDRVCPGLGAVLDRDTVWRLLFTGARDVALSDARRIVRPVLLLQSAFARHYGLTRREALAHRGSVVRAICGGLGRAAASSLRATYTR